MFHILTRCWGSNLQLLQYGPKKFLSWSQAGRFSPKQSVPVWVKPSSRSRAVNIELISFICRLRGTKWSKNVRPGAWRHKESSVSSLITNVKPTKSSKVDGSLMWGTNTKTFHEEQKLSGWFRSCSESFFRSLFRCLSRIEPSQALCKQICAGRLQAGVGIQDAWRCGSVDFHQIILVFLSFALKFLPGSPAPVFVRTSVWLR